MEQIQWDPTGQLLASCSNDNYVCIWKPENNQPKIILKGCGSAVNTIKWSQADGQNEANPLLAAGTQDGFILIWNVEQGNPPIKLPAHDKE